ncbi:hypothetical protein AB1N83_005516 [Pleurotus pulmonarius]
MVPQVLSQCLGCVPQRLQRPPSATRTHTNLQDPIVFQRLNHEGDDRDLGIGAIVERVWVGFVGGSNTICRPEAHLGGTEMRGAIVHRAGEGRPGKLRLTATHV